MTSDAVFSMCQLESILDSSPASVMVSALEDQELLYMNQAARSMISAEYQDRGRKCYELFGLHKPCPVCPLTKGSQKNEGCHELVLTENGHTYRFSGNEIDWAGRPARLEYIWDITEQKQMEQELDHLVNFIPGGIVSCQVKEGRFIPLCFSDNIMAISGHTREEYNEIIKQDLLNLIHEADRKRVLEAAIKSIEQGTVLYLSCRVRHKNGQLIWIHLNGRRLGPLSDNVRFYAIFSVMSPERILFHNISNEVSDAVYVIAKDSYELLYANETNSIFSPEPGSLGKQCFAALRGKSAPCEFCSITKGIVAGEEHEKIEDGTERIFQVHYRETDWDGIPVYVKYMKDVTEEVQTRREKERLDIYFRSIVEQFPGGISMMVYGTDGTLKPEFISHGFAAMTQRTVEEARLLYEEDAFAGIHPDDVRENWDKLQHFLKNGKAPCELVTRMKRKDGSYFWVSSILSMLPSTDNVSRIYIVYTDITAMMEEKEQLRRRYEEQLLQHYHKPGANELILGHCNISRNKIVEIRDSTDSMLLKRFGIHRNLFFQGLSGLIIKDEDRKAFLDSFLNEPMLMAFADHKTEQVMNCFIRLPEEAYGRYVQFKVNLLMGPDGEDVIGILTVTDITEQTISERIFHHLSVTSHDYVIDVDLLHDSYAVLTFKEGAACVPEPHGCLSERVAYMTDTMVLKKDSKQYAHALEAEQIRRSLKEGPYRFTYSVAVQGDIRIKSMMVASIEPWLDRYCITCTDITDSVREQQGLLNMMAYTFELMGLLDFGNGSFTMYTRKMVLKNLPPEVLKDYEDVIELFTDSAIASEPAEDFKKQFQIDSILEHLEKEPSGYDFVVDYKTGGSICYKQFNMLWGDQNHSTVCVVRADVTDMIAAERSTKKELEKALALAKEANQAKSNFLSAMSHDIRTPMNAIIGMTTLASAHIDDLSRVKDCLKKISISSRHLLSLVNDVLDMSRIEQSKIVLSHIKLFLPDLLDQISAILTPQAREKGVELSVRAKDITHSAFYGDSLRINQILINLLGNAFKFTPAGGKVDFLVEETKPVGTPGFVRYRFHITDTGIGMNREFLGRMFEPFTREQTAERLEGTGLGLSITKRLVDLMGGKISVESEPNRGSKFLIELEFQEAECSLELEEDISGARRQGTEKVFWGRRFLIAEDNEINAEILCELLQMEGASSDLRINGAQAVLAFKQAAPGTYDAILMDIQMPEMNGYEATREIRRLDHEDARSIPIIAMTANAFAEDVQAALEAGMTAHVAKPIDMDILRSALGEVFV